MNRLNRKLFKTLGLGWLALAIAGLLINLLMPAPALAVLIDRSYCPPEAWAQVVQQYDKLYQQHQQGSLKIQEVILFSDLGEEVLSPAPTRDDLQKVSTYGRPNPARRSQLQAKHPNATLLSCS